MFSEVIVCLYAVEVLPLRASEFNVVVAKLF